MKRLSDFASILIFFAVLGGIGFLLARTRTRSFKKYADGCGMIFREYDLPDLPLPDTSLREACAIENVLTGARHGHEVIFFDYRIGAAQQSISYSVVAVRGLTPGFGPELLDFTWKSERAGEWTFMSRRGQMSVRDLDALLSGV
jgi:hypothetical protein